MILPCELSVNTDYRLSNKLDLIRRKYFAFIDNCICCFLRGVSIKRNFGKDFIKLSKESYKEVVDR